MVFLDGVRSILARGYFGWEVIDSPNGVLRKNTENTITQVNKTHTLIFSQEHKNTRIDRIQNIFL